MQTEAVHFYSEGERITALWRTPDTRPGRCARSSRAPAGSGSRTPSSTSAITRRSPRPASACSSSTTAGSATRAAPRSGSSPRVQLEDLVNAVTYLTTRDDVDADAIGVFGTGGTGGGNAMLLAAADRAIKAAVSQVPVADGEDWLHRMRSESRLARLPRTARARTAGSASRPARAGSCSPREEIMVPTAGAAGDHGQGRRGRTSAERGLAALGRRDPRRTARSTPRAGCARRCSSSGSRATRPRRPTTPSRCTTRRAARRR